MRDIPAVTWVFALVLAVEALISFWNGRLSLGLVSTMGLALMFVPVVFASRLNLRLPVSMLVAASAFIFATLYLGEVQDFYERFHWWDILVHAGSALALGVMGFLYVFALFGGDKYAAPPAALAAIAFCFAVSIGAIWEIFEYAMDQTLGLNMQKSGLPDTMLDLIVDCGGAAAGALAGYLYLKGWKDWMTGLLHHFVRLNRRHFRKSAR